MSATGVFFIPRLDVYDESIDVRLSADTDKWSRLKLFSPTKCHETST